LGGGSDDARLRARNGAQMALDHAHGLRRITGDCPAAVRAPEHARVRRFVDAVLALSDDPKPENVEQYLVASRALEDSRSRRKPRPSRAA
jgi:hypothetical protein